MSNITQQPHLTPFLPLILLSHKIMEQTRALNALEPFLLLSRSANSARAAADLVTQATSAPNTYVFAELLHTPNIQALRQSAEYAGHLRMLEIFAWGSWGDYYRTDQGAVNGDADGNCRLTCVGILMLGRSFELYSGVGGALCLICYSLLSARAVSYHFHIILAKQNHLTNIRQQPQQHSNQPIRASHP